MTIENQLGEVEMAYALPVTVHDAEGSHQVERETLYEHLMDVYINERLTMKLICTPEYLPELVLGRMLTEGIITGTDDVRMIYVCRYGSRARVLLNRTEKNDEAQKKTNTIQNTGIVERLDAVQNTGISENLDETVPDPDARHQESYIETTPSCCTGNHILNDYFTHDIPLYPIKIALPVHNEDIQNLFMEFKKDSPLHKKTHATHSAMLYINEKIAFQCEDIGRHNAVDKAIGYALENNLDLKHAMIFTSGRVPTDMMEKIIRAQIPVLVTKEAPTREAVILAHEYHVQLIGNVRDGQYCIY